MLTNTPRTIIVDGVNSSSPTYKRNEVETVKSQFYVVGKSDTALGTVSISVTDEIKGYFIKPILLHEVSVYDITGYVTPGDKLVYLSSGFTPGNIDSLKDNVIATTYADKTGKFKFSNIAYQYGTISLWTTHLAQDAVTSSLSYQLSIVDYNPNIGELLTYSFYKPEGDCENPMYTITGYCSEDIDTLYLSSTSNAMSVTKLMENMCCSTQPSNGKFKIQYTGEYEQTYIIWGLSKTNGRLEVNTIKIEVENDVSTCLSGDTMITMADNSAKRMDEICVGDVVLSKDGELTSVHTVRRGHFSNYHILYHFEDGTVINETHPHRFYNTDQGFWQRLQAWNIGDHAINRHGKEIALVFVEHVDECTEMFGIWTDNGTYYANGLLSGAAFCNKELLAEATAEQAIDMMLSADEELLVQLMGLEGVLP